MLLWSLLDILQYSVAAAAAAKLHQSCPTLCDPIDGSPTGSTVPGILQTRTLEWVAISLIWPLDLVLVMLAGLPPQPISPAASQVLLLSRFSRVRLCATP